ASASIQLDLRVNLPPAKLSAIVHLIANAVEGLEPEHVTVVDTKGRLIFKGGSGDSESSGLSGSQLDYKKKIENQTKGNVQTMLERIVGIDKAIVRVNAEIDFEKITLNQEEYDPTATAVRSSRNIEENSQIGQKGAETEQALINERRGVLPSPVGTQNKKTKKDVATNYEVNKTIRTTLKPAGTIKRLSVAAVIDGIYEFEKLNDGTTKRKYIARTEQELKKFEEIVKRAMGYNEDREDQITVSSISFSETSTMDNEAAIAPSKLDLIFQIVKDYRKTIVNLLLVAMVFIFIVKPLLKSMKGITKEAVFTNEELTAVSDEYAQLPESRGTDRRNQVVEITQKNPEKAQQLIKGWIGEQE
ncbi:MAG: flagellar M-ring protein FliF, partial [Desulfobacteraceae bacterium]